MSSLILTSSSYSQNSGCLQIHCHHSAACAETLEDQTTSILCSSVSDLSVSVSSSEATVKTEATVLVPQSLTLPDMFWDLTPISEDATSIACLQDLLLVLFFALCLIHLLGVYFIYVCLVKQKNFHSIQMICLALIVLKFNCAQSQLLTFLFGSNSCFLEKKFCIFMPFAFLLLEKR